MITVQVSYLELTDAMRDESRWHFEMPWPAREAAYIKEKLKEAGVPLKFTLGSGIFPSRGELSVTHHLYEKVTVYQWREKTMRPTEQQVGGSHYKHLKLQPVELAYMLNATPAFKDVAKYLTREKCCRDEDWQKAIHFAQLEEQMIRTYPAARSAAHAFERTAPTWKEFCEKQISTFASQFPEPVGTTTYTALTCMLRGEYQEVTECIQHYLDYCRRNGWPNRLRLSDKNKDYKG